MSGAVPKVSIGLPVYNGSNYLALTFDRILSQTFTDFEVIVCDNDSKDDTAKICAEYCSRDSRIRYYKNDSNIGAAPNFNRTFELSRGKYFAWAAHDDMYDLRFLEKCVKVLDEHPDVVLAHSALAFVDDDDNPIIFREGADAVAAGKPIRDIYGNSVMKPDQLNIAESQSAQERFHEVLHKVHWCLQVFGLARSDVLRRTGLQRSYYGADKVFLAEISLAGRFHQIDEVLFTKRIHRQMSFYQTTKEKRKWIDPNSRHRLPQLQMIKDYAVAVTRNPLSFGQRLKCFFAIAGLINRPGLWHKIFVPGPYNYLGINFGK